MPPLGKVNVNNYNSDPIDKKGATEVTGKAAFNPEQTNIASATSGSVFGFGFPSNDSGAVADNSSGAGGGTIGIG